MNPDQTKIFVATVNFIFNTLAGELQDNVSKINRICEIEKQMNDIVERYAKGLTERKV